MRRPPGRKGRSNTFNLRKILSGNPVFTPIKSGQAFPGSCANQRQHKAVRVSTPFYTQSPRDVILSGLGRADEADHMFG
jgi:hypothetical protein